MNILRNARLTGGLAAVVVAGIASASVLPLTAEASGPRAALAAAAPYEPPGFPETRIGPAVNPDLPNIVVIDAGGTISSMARDRISYLNYQGSVNGGVQTILEDMYPELARVANLTVARSTGSLSSSSSVTFKTLYDISLKADEYLARDDVDGVVVTAGTNVLEEDAYFLDLTIRSPKPVVMTGSMHQYGTFTYDGYTNLFSSIRLAASEKTTCYGTVVLLNDQFFASREVTKQDGYRMDTFGAGNYGALGVVNQENIRTMRAPARIQDCGTDDWRTPFDLRAKSPSDLARVELVNGYIEASGVPIEALAADGVDGIVSSGHGPGGLSSAQSVPRRNAISNGVLFISATRTGGEGNYDTGSAGSINAGDLLPQKARILAMLALTYSNSEPEIRSWFNAIGNPEFDFSESAGTEVPSPSPVVEPAELTLDVPMTRFGSAAMLRVSLSSDGEPVDGTVSVSVDGGTAQPVTLIEGVGTLELERTLAVGSHAAQATYAGTETVEPAQTTRVFTVEPAASAVVLTAPTTVSTRERVSVSAAIRVSGSTMAPEGFVRFRVTGGPDVIVPVTRGVAQADLGTFRRGAVVVRAVFSPTGGSVASSSATRTINVR